MSGEVGKPGKADRTGGLAPGAAKQIINDLPDLSAVDAVFAESEIQSIHEPDSPANENSFAQTVQTLQKISDSVNDEMPSELKGAKIPRAEILYKSPLTENPKTTVVLMPEQHIFTARDPFELTNGICPYAAKVLNSHLLKKLFENDSLNITSSLHESSVKMDEDMKADFQTTLDTDRTPAFYYANHLSVANGSDSIPAESVDEELKTIAQRFMLMSLLFVETQSAVQNKAFADPERQQLIQSLGYRTINDIGMSMTAQVNDANRILDAKGLPKEKLASVIKEVESVISPHSFISVDQGGIPRFDFAAYQAINPLARRSLLNYLYSITGPQALVRDEAMAENISKLNGVYPMIVGATHTSNLVRELESQGIGVCVLGANCYYEMMPVDLRQADFSSRLENQKQAIRKTAEEKFAAVRQYI